MVNGLRFTTNLTLYPFTMLTSSPWKKSPNVRPRTKNKASIFVNSFSFNFLEFFAKIYWANFFPWAKEEKIGQCAKTRTGLAPEAGWAGRPRPTGPEGFGGRRRRVLPELLLFDFLLWSGNFKGSVKK
jgi:hypothetical protein